MEQTQPSVQKEEWKTAFDAMMAAQKQLIASQDQFINTQTQLTTDLRKDFTRLEAFVAQLQTRSKMMDTQIAQMGQQISSQNCNPTHFPSQPDPSNKGPGQMNARTTRSGKITNDLVPPLQVKESSSKVDDEEVVRESDISDVQVLRLFLSFVHTLSLHLFLRGWLKLDSRSDMVSFCRWQKMLSSRFLCWMLLHKFYLLQDLSRIW